ncbi:P-loop containing nucleoside triphosphate hydrolase protein [Mycena latifolia]|nr:P-loop containing nucleoside triphosphate hydrolase protein [Mycena latifolia]
MAPQSESVSVEPRTARTVPMRVLGLGFSRTGTASLQLALEQLGYVRTNHGFAVISSSPEKISMWIAAIRAKLYGEGAPFGRAEWDQLLGDCQAITDVPHILFAEELIAAYPEAKVVLTTRSAESWWKSYEATIAPTLAPPLAVRLSGWLDPEYTGKKQELARLVFEGLFGTARAAAITADAAKARFRAYNDAIRRLVPPDRLLEFEVKEGWAPLVAFLGKEPPPTAFPRVNDTAQFNTQITLYHSAQRRAVLWAWARKFGGPLVAVAAAALLLYVRRPRRV